MRGDTVTEKQYKNFCAWVNDVYSGEAKNQILRAWDLVAKHQGYIFRRDNTLYLDHLEMAACYISRWGFGPSYVQGAILHDIVEDCEEISLAFIHKEFGSFVCKMVSYMSRNKLSGYANYAIKIEAWLKKNPYFIFIRLADQYHNVCNYEGYKSSESKKRNCREIIETVERAEIIIMQHNKLQKNQFLQADLLRLKEIALKLL